MDFDKVPTAEEEELMRDPEYQSGHIFDVGDAYNASHGGHRDVFPTGFSMMDGVMTGGIGDGDLVLISGRSGHGKTTFAQTISYHLATIGIPQFWFSYEVQPNELMEKFKSMGLTKENFPGFMPMKNKSGNVEWLEMKIREAILKFNAKVIFIDHLGFLSPKPDMNNVNMDRNTSLQLGYLVRQLKKIALEENVIVVLLAHVRKTKEELDIDDIAHSGGIAQESDFVFMVERLREQPVRSNKWAKAPEEGIVYSQYSRISLVKNRRTGQMKFVKVEMKQGRLQEVKPGVINDASQPTEYIIE